MMAPRLVRAAAVAAVFGAGAPGRMGAGTGPSAALRSLARLGATPIHQTAALLRFQRREHVVVCTLAPFRLEVLAFQYGRATLRNQSENREFDAIITILRSSAR